jgi:3-phenylpropionate/trans-cinnamate dioxygenase ferredoxin component
MAQGRGYVRVAGVDEVPPGQKKLVRIAERRLLLANVWGQLYALDNRCPHDGGPLAFGDLENDEITCPRHRWRWNLPPGAPLARGRSAGATV